MKPCCACPDTRDLRDDCIIKYADWEVSCKAFIEAHNQCLRAHGFFVDSECNNIKEDVNINKN